MIRRCPPTFLCVGAAKCGTSTLHHYLSLHPEVSMPKVKERNFFHTGHGQLHWEWGWDRSKAIRGECDPHYFRYPDRIRQRYPNVKILILVREPVSRIVSHVQNEVLLGRIKPDAWDWGEIVEGHWAYQASHYRSMVESFTDFDHSVMALKDLQSDPQAFFDRVCQFIGASSYEAPEGLYTNPARVSLSIPDEQRERLAGLFVESNKWLLDHYGIDL